MDGAKSLDAGANGFITKPVDFDVLLARMATLLGLTWIHAPMQAEAPLDSPLTFPSAMPAGDMSELHQLAREGNMRGIVQWAERMAAGDPPNAAFAAHLRQLARAYQSKAILHLVERYFEGNTTS